MNYYKTHILKNLIHKRLLNDRLSFLFKEDAGEIEAFLRSIYSNEISVPPDNIVKNIPLLLKHGYISNIDTCQPGRCSLMGVDAVDFELTYKCSANCPHCLQKNIRRNHITELSTAKVKEAILQAHLSGLCTRGINFTGGEVLGNREDLFEILKYTNSLKIPFRLNTNSWWSRGKLLNIGNMTFPTALDLVNFLKSNGLFQFAFSFDGRLDEPKLMKNLVESIKLCEKAAVFYQIIFTGIGPEAVQINLNQLQNEIDRVLCYLIPVSMEMVDVGGASDLGDAIYGWQSNRSTCENKGFYHPELLHVSPDGKIRTCMYAVGLDNVGDLTQKSFANIVNEFPNTKNNEVFSNQAKNKEIYEKLVVPYLSLYKPIIHECTRNAILAKTLEMYHRHPEPNLEAIHNVIANDLNLKPNPGL